MAVRHRRRWLALPGLLALATLVPGPGCEERWNDDDDTGVGDDDDFSVGDDDDTADDDDTGDDDTLDPSWTDVLPAVDPEGDSGHTSVDLMRYQFRHEDGALDLRAWSWTPFDDDDGDLTLRLCLRDPVQAYCLVHDNVSPVPSATQLWTTRDDLAIWAQLDPPATLAMDPDLAYSTLLGLELEDTALDGCAFEGAAEVVDAGGSGDAAPDTTWTSGLWSPFELGDVLLLSLETVHVDDGAGGDGDGIPEPAETLALLPTVTNTGCGPSARRWSPLRRRLDRRLAPWARCPGSFGGTGATLQDFADEAVSGAFEGAVGVGQGIPGGFQSPRVVARPARTVATAGPDHRPEELGVGVRGCRSQGVFHQHRRLARAVVSGQDEGRRLQGGPRLPGFGAGQLPQNLLGRVRGVAGQAEPQQVPILGGFALPQRPTGRFDLGVCQGNADRRGGGRRGRRQLERLRPARVHQRQVHQHGLPSVHVVVQDGQIGIDALVKQAGSDAVGHDRLLDPGLEAGTIDLRR
ncbi:MAG: hypothetical protein QGH45_05175, partial [Myxococcota bacterium]|nr:hypothetical protein [Myxococcota bacterium]